MIRSLSFLLIFAIFLAPGVSAADEEAADSSETLEALSANKPRADGAPEEHAEFSSVNYSEEFSFKGKRRNIDGFLGEMSNPLRRLPEDYTYEGTRSDDRHKVDDSKWWE